MDTSAGADPQAWTTFEIKETKDVGAARTQIRRGFKQSSRLVIDVETIEPRQARELVEWAKSTYPGIDQITIVSSTLDGDLVVMAKG